MNKSPAEIIKNLIDETNKKQEINHIGHKEFKAMKKQKYEKNKDKIKTSYVIQNKKTKKIVEVNAISSILAAKTVGWRSRHTVVLRVNNSDGEIL